MPHALIIEDNVIVSRLLERQLIQLGYDSFDRVWTEADAVAAAERRVPDIILVGDEVETGSGVEAARTICARRSVPVILVTGDSHRARRRLPPHAAMEGPFGLHEIDDAMASARVRQVGHA